MKTMSNLFTEKSSYNSTHVRNELKKLADKKKAQDLKWFFKTGPGEYGEGDEFIGVVMPKIRIVVAKYWQLPLEETIPLVRSKIHEERMAGLLILVKKYEHAGKQKNLSQRKNDFTSEKIFQAEEKKIYNLYFSNKKYINNWDLIDVTCRHVIGKYLYDKDRDILFKLAVSKSLWDRRLSIISTFYFIGENDFATSLAISEILVHDKEDLIQKAVGWMLREIGNRDKEAELMFLHKHYKTMPRTMLRYAIEKFPEEERQAFLKGKIN